MHTVAIILAAGASTRMGRPKALLELGGLPLWLAHAAAVSSVVDRVLVVTGAVPLPATPDIEMIHNPDWAQTWPADSLRLALQQVSSPSRALVIPVDTPPAMPATLELLLAQRGPAVPVDDGGGPGHPVLLGPEQVTAVREHAPDGGLRSLLADAPRFAVADPHIAIDFDTPEAWHRFASQLDRERLAR